MESELVLSDQLLQQLQASGEVRVQDTHGVPIVLMTVDARQQLERVSTLDEEYFREKLHEGMAAIQAGEVSDWDVEQLKATVRQRHASQNPSV